MATSFFIWPLSLERRRDDDVDTSLLKSFVTLARRLNFTEAARDLHLTQPSLSRQIALIEKEVGTQLIDRSKQHLSLTYAGTIYLEGACAILTRYSKTLEEISNLATGKSGHLSIAGFVYGLGNHVIQSFREKYPLIRLKIHPGTVPGNIDELLHKGADLCFGVYFPQLAHSDVAFQNLGKMELCVALEEDHRLADYETIKVSELESEVIVSRFVDSELNLCLEGLFVSHGFTPNFETRHASNMLEMFTDLRGAVSLWPSGYPLYGAQEIPITVVGIKEEDFGCDYGVWYREDSHNPALPLFLEELMLGRT
jgi:DNA-binding transcriptional LysR family regulator